MKSLGSWRQPFWSKVQSGSLPPAVWELSMEHWAAAVWRGCLFWAETHTVVGMGRKWVRVRGVRVRSFQVCFWVDLQSRRINYNWVRKCVLLLLWESDALVSWATRWHHEMLSVRPASWVCWGEVQPVCERESQSERDGSREHGCCSAASSAENSVLAVRFGCCRYCAPPLLRHRPLLLPPLHWPGTPQEASEALRSRLLPLSAPPRWMADDLWAYSNGQSLRGRGISKKGETRVKRWLGIFC